jgi:hypothetical protein
MAIVVTMRWMVVPWAEVGSSGIAAAISNAAPAIPSSRRPATALAPIASASPRRASPTVKIDMPTTAAAGSPGSARRLIVFSAGS